MSLPAFPVALEQKPLLGSFSETGAAVILRSQMDSGVAKTRRRGKAPHLLTVSHAASSAGVDTFREFVEDTIKFTGRFTYPHPRKAATLTVRLVPSGDGQAYSISDTQGAFYVISFTLEVMPS